MPGDIGDSDVKYSDPEVLMAWGSVYSMYNGACKIAGQSPVAFGVMVDKLKEFLPEFITLSHFKEAVDEWTPESGDYPHVFLLCVYRTFRRIFMTVAPIDLPKDILEKTGRAVKIYRGWYPMVELRYDPEGRLVIFYLRNGERTCAESSHVQDIYPRDVTSPDMDCNFKVVNAGDIVPKIETKKATFMIGGAPIDEIRSLDYSKADMTKFKKSFEDASKKMEKLSEVLRKHSGLEFLAERSDFASIDPDIAGIMLETNTPKIKGD